MDAPIPRTPSRSPSLAAFLSFLWPGLGQVYVGHPRTGLLYAVPPLIVAMIVIGQASRGIEVLAVQLFSPSFALTALVLAVVLGLWRLLSMIDALTTAGPARRWQRPAAVAVFAALAGIVLATHVALAMGAYQFYQHGCRMFACQDEPDRPPVPTPAAPTESGATEPPNATAPATGAVETPPVEVTPPPTATPLPDERVNVLIVGVDSAPGRDAENTDTMIVASFDPRSGRVSMLTFPRDIGRFRLWDGRRYLGKLNSLYSWAKGHPDRFPDGPIGSLMKELGYLSGVPIHYYAQIDLRGMRQMIDVVGGIDIVNDKLIDDPTYQFTPTQRGFRLEPGPHHLTGERAMAYMRSRHGRGNSDFERARRQQEVLLALRRKLTDISMLPRLPQVLEAASQTIRTNFPSGRLSELLAYAKSVDETGIQRVVLSPPDYAQRANTSVYMIELDMEAVAEVSRQLFGQDSRYWEGSDEDPDAGDEGATPGPD